MPLSATGSVSSLVQSLGEIPPEAVVFGRSEVMQAVRDRLDKVAAANVPVLIQGESGTGKDIIARLIHTRSPWKTGPYVKVNCPAIPGTLLESELFGYEKGAFTGAYGAKPGRVEMAHRGTLFLDEISELDLALQAKLLQLLQDGQFCRIGAQEDKKVEVRVVCATNRQLEVEIESGTFRQDLFYRINVVNLHLPPLRERRGDIADLANFFLDYYNRKYNCRARNLSNDLMQVLQKYHWPGNIRELENVIERAIVLGSSEMIEIDTLPGPLRQPPDRQDVSLELPPEGIDLEVTLDRIEQRYMQMALDRVGGVQTRAAELLRVSFRQFRYKLQKFQQQRETPREG